MNPNMSTGRFNEHFCHFNLPTHYELHWLLIYSFVILIGLFYGFFGYRCWRLNMFLTSFSLGAFLLYIILDSQPTLNESQLISIASSIAILIGLIGALLQYVGLFINGFCFGLIVSIITFIGWDLRNTSQGISTTFWLPIGLILSLGLCGAMLTLKFQKTMLIISSACSAGFCQFLVLDYFLQSSILSNFIQQRFLFQSNPNLCLRHWLIILIFPIVMLFSIVIQCSWTGRNYDHHDAWHRAIHAGKKRNIKRIRRKNHHHDTLREQIIPNESDRFRYFHQIRRTHGDALSSDFIQNVRQQNPPTVQSNPNSSSNNSAQPTRIDTDSTTTTLSHLM